MTRLRRLWCKIFHFPTYQMGGNYDWRITCQKCNDSWLEKD